MRIVYFSGTGGARRIALEFARQVGERGLPVSVQALDSSVKPPPAPDGAPAQAESTATILVFCVHAFDAPEPVYAWLAGAVGRGQRTAVISVSAGGEAFPNTGCRQHLIQALAQRGFDVTYEKMMVMPCNWVVPISDALSMHLLGAVPDKVGRILDRFLSGAVRRTPGRLDPLRAWMRDAEKRYAPRFVGTLRVTEACTGCAWCARHCPTDNIRLENRRPEFGTSCVMCFRCVYGCPQHAMQSRDFQVLRSGFDLDALEKRMRGQPLPPVAECCKGMLWAGVRRYLDDSDGY